MTTRIEADEEKCLAYGNCVAAAPDVYEVVDQKVRIVDPEPSDAALPAARKGVRRCPAKALRLVETG